MGLSVSFNLRRSVTRRIPGGFTLVELLVVLAIISLLAALLLPVIKKAADAANRTVCQSNIRQLAAACILYSQENRRFFPNARRFQDDPLERSPLRGRYADWVKTEPSRRLQDSAIAKYLGNSGAPVADSFRKVLVCPGDSGVRPIPPILPECGVYWPSYAIHQQLSGQWTSQRRLNQSLWHRKIMLAEVDDPVDSIWFEWRPYLFRPRNHLHGDSRLATRHGMRFEPRLGKRIAANASVAFFDGHVETMNDWDATAYHFNRLDVPMNEVLR